MKCYVYNHHDFWQWPMGDGDFIDARVAFMWADWPLRSEVQMLRSMGKKVVVYEHGFGSAFDYELNDRDPIADGYIVLGQESKESLIRVGVDPKRIIVTGNPIYDGIKKTKHTGNEALYTIVFIVNSSKFF